MKTKYATYKLVERSIKRGILNKKPCEVCGNQKTVAHHDDYAKPIDVRWLCQTHHVEWHRENRAKNKNLKMSGGARNQTNYKDKKKFIRFWLLRSTINRAKRRAKKGEAIYQVIDRAVKEL